MSRASPRGLAFQIDLVFSGRVSLPAGKHETIGNPS